MAKIQIKEFPAKAAKELIHVYETYEAHLASECLNVLHLNKEYGHKFGKSEFDERPFLFNLVLEFSGKFDRVGIIDREDPIETEGEDIIERCIQEFIQNKKNDFNLWLNEERTYKDNILPTFQAKNCEILIDSDLIDSSHSYLSRLFDVFGGEKNLKEVMLRVCLAKIYYNHFMFEPHRLVRPTNKQILDSKELVNNLLELFDQSPYFKYRNLSLYNNLKRFMRHKEPENSKLQLRLSKHSARNQLIFDAYRIIKKDFTFPYLKKYEVPAELLKSILKRVGYEIDTRELYSQIARVDV